MLQINNIMSAPENPEGPVLDDILKKMPYRRQKDQSQKLAAYMQKKMEGGPTYIVENTSINSKATVNNIRKKFKELPEEEQTRLMTHLLTIIRNRNHT